MTLAAAQQFIQRVIADSDLVDQINDAADSDDIRKILGDLNLPFNHEEFEQAYYNVLTWCQTYEQADIVKGIKLWWDCLGYSLSQAS